MRRLLAPSLLCTLAVLACGKSDSRSQAIKVPATPTLKASAPANPPPASPAQLNFSLAGVAKLPNDISGLISLQECAATYGKDPAIFYTDVDQERSFVECRKGNAEECSYADAAVHYRDVDCKIRVSLQGCLSGEPTLCSYVLAPEVDGEIELRRSKLTLENELVVAAYAKGCSLGDAKGCKEVAKRVPGAINRESLAAHFAWACEQNDPLGCHERAISLWPFNKDPKVWADAIRAMKVGCAVGSEGAWMRDSCLAATLLQSGKSPEFERLNQLCVRDAAFVSPEVCMAVARKLPKAEGDALWHEACSGLEPDHVWGQDCPDIVSSDEELVTRLLRPSK